MEEYVILVDEQDTPVGLMEKQAAHVTPHLHRAFSKYHSPGLWTNTCCSHPRDGETLAEATSRRLWEEMGMRCDMHEVYTFIYKAPVGEGLTEHEFDHVWIGQSDDIPSINTDEVASWKYMALNDLEKDIELHPEHYTEWFKITFAEMTRHAGVFLS